MDGIKKNKMNISITERKKLDLLWFGIVFIYSLNFLGLRLFWLLSLFFIGFIISIYKKSTIKITVDFLLICLFSVSYFIILFYHGKGGMGMMLLYMIGPIMSFFIGYITVKHENSFIYKTILAMAIGNFLYGFLNIMMYFRIYVFNPSIIGR